MKNFIRKWVSICYVNMVQSDGSMLLCRVPLKVCRAIQYANIGTTGRDRRYFKEEYDPDFDTMYHTIIEVTHEEYLEWYAEHRKESRHEQNWEKMDYQTLSLDIPVDDEMDALTFKDAIPDLTADTERDGMMASRLDDLREDLAAWKPWAVEVLDYFLADQNRSCTKILAQKYHRSEGDVRYWKRCFMDHVKEYYIAHGFVDIT